MELEECYKILEAEENEKLEDIYGKYLLLCKKYHPDMYPLEMQKMWATEKFIIIDRAYKTIINARAKTEEEKTMNNEILAEILKKMDKKIEHGYRVTRGLNVYLLGAIVEIIFMGVAVIFLMSAFKQGRPFGYVLIVFLVLGFIFLWKVIRS